MGGQLVSEWSAGIGVDLYAPVTLRKQSFCSLASMRSMTFPLPATPLGATNVDATYVMTLRMTAL